MGFDEIAGVVMVVILIILLARVLVRRCLVNATIGGAETELRLVDLRDTHRLALERITSNKSTMAMVGDGKPWSRAKVLRFLTYNKIEQRQGEARKNFYWGISAGNNKRGELVGVIGIHPVDYGRPKTEGLFFLTIFLAPETIGKNYGKMATAEALASFWSVRGDPVYSDVRKDNLSAQHLMSRAGFVFVGESEVRNKTYLRYRKKNS